MVILHATTDVPATRQRMLRDPDGSDTVVIAIDFDPLPAATDVPPAIRTAVSVAAARVWPGRYASVLSLTLDKGFASDAAIHSAIAAAGLDGRVSAAWLRAAASLVATGRPPMPSQGTFLESLAPLAALFGDAPALVFCIMTGAVPAERLDALGRILAGIAAKTLFRVHLVVPESVAGSLELDQVNYAVAKASVGTGRPSIAEPGEGIGGLGAAVCTLGSHVQAAADEPAVTVSAIVGKPHPESPGEQKLAGWLADDQMLCSLFQFNQPVRTVRQSTYRVDLVWPAGLVVVEVDGYSTHSTPHQFRLDRQRDYELSLTGYVVLRLTHQEIMQDVRLAGEKIRDVVRFRQESPLKGV